MSEPHPGRAMPRHTADGQPARMATNVEIRVRGPVPADRAERLGLRASVAPAHTVLRGTVADLPALHGALERIRAGGLEIVDVRRLPPRGCP